MEEGKKVIQVTELLLPMNWHHDACSCDRIISTCMSLGLFVSINQRLDAEDLTLVADEFGYKVEFVSVEVQEAIHGHEADDRPEDLSVRAPIVTGDGPC